MIDTTNNARTLQTPTVTASRFAQQDFQVTVDGTLGVVFIIGVALIVFLGVATAGLAIYRYRNRNDPALRAFVVGLVLVAVAPLPLQVFIAGTVPERLRSVLLPIFQTMGLLSILWAMYGDSRSSEVRLIRRLTSGDLSVVTVSLILAISTVVFRGHSTIGPLVLGTVLVVVGLGTFVAGQALRAAYRYQSPAMGSLSVGILSLVVLPMPISVILSTVSFSKALLVGLILGFVLVGEIAMFATLLYR